MAEPGQDKILVQEYSLIEKFDLRKRLEFKPSEGQIWFDEARMILQHVKGMTSLRRELIEQLGISRTRAIFWRMGFESGRLDARVAAKHHGKAEDYDVFCIGPALHAFEGVAHAHIVEADIDWEQGKFEGVVHWKESWEAQAHLADDIPVADDHIGTCWAATGYASGYATEFFKRLVVFQETQCASEGHGHCICVGKPADMWEDQSFVTGLLNAPDTQGQFELEDELRSLRRARNRTAPASSPVKPDNIVGSSAPFLQAFNLLGKAANGAINVLLLGETGVGKEVFARWLHEHSGEANGPFVAVNCSAIPAELVEAELFGVRRGAYTGATETRQGRFERANGGTLFLDEVGELPLAAQAKLLRVLQTGEIERLGDVQPMKVKVRLISATNVDLTDAMRKGDFRSDLYYRLATYPITIPPLRDRPGDVALLAQAMIRKFAPAYGKAIPGITDRAMYALESYHWPGNVRELENFIERAVLLVDCGTEIEVEHLPPALHDLTGFFPAHPMAGGGPDPASRKRDLVRELLDMGADMASQEAMLIREAMERTDGNIAAAAALLNISRRQMAYRVEKLEADPSEINQTEN